MTPQPVITLLLLCIFGSAYSLSIRNAVADPGKLWPNGKVPYVFHPGIDAYRRVHVLSGMKQLMLSTYSNGNPCIVFVPRSNENDYIQIQFTENGAVGSNIGRVGGMQTVTIDREITQSNIAQALMFVLGVYPEVSRTDRDNFLDVNQTNIDPAAAKNFQIQTSTDSFQQPFDYETVAMYLPYFGAVDKSVPTIKTQQPGFTIGQAISLSNGDINLIQHIYKCPLDSSHRVDVLGPMLFECHFHSDFCTFTNDDQDNFDWVLSSGPTPSPGTGPLADHSSGSGNFAYAQSKGHYSQIARLKTPTLPAGIYCVVIWIHAYGSDVGQLRVIQTNTDGDKTIFSVSGLPINQWYHGSGNVASSSPVTVNIEVFTGSGDQGDVAIDDVYIYNGRCIDWY